MPSHFCIRLGAREPSALLIALLRRHTDKTIAQLRDAIIQQKPIIDEQPHHNGYSAFIEALTNLLNELEARGFEYLVELDGRSKSPEYLRNVFNRWHKIGKQLKEEDDLASDD